MSSSASSVGLGITTKDRWDDLAVTLDHLKATGLDTLETVVMDDGSQTPMPADFRVRFPWVKFERVETSRGLIAQRNYLATRLDTPFYLSLDDDSFPIAGSLDAAADWLEAHPKVSVIGFRIILKADAVPADFSSQVPVPTRDFTGCGFLLRRDLFLSLGGFEERFHIYCEEMEYSLRTYRLGYETYFFPALVIRHMLSSSGRLAKPRAYMLIRNHVLTALWFYPFPYSFVWGIWWSLIKVPFPGKKTLDDRCNILFGGLKGWWLFCRWTGKQRLSHAQFRAWRGKPFLASL
jgi:GT2 family glycosyltransferase